jgi:hypothetical protein
MIATWSCPGRTGSGWACARMQALTRRRLKRSAWPSVSREIANCFTPGVPKSLLVLPTAITRVS